MMVDEANLKGTVFKLCGRGLLGELKPEGPISAEAHDEVAHEAVGKS